MCKAKAKQFCKTLFHTIYIPWHLVMFGLKHQTFQLSSHITCKNYAEERSLTKRSRFNVIIAICQEGHYIAAVTRTGVIRS